MTSQNNHHIRVKLFGYGAALLFLVVGVLIFRKLAFGNEPPKKKSIPNAVKVVNVIEATPSDNPVRIAINGKLESFNKLELFTEVGGRFLKGSKNFKEGIGYNTGEVLISIDSRDARAALIAQRSSFQTILTSILPDMKLDYSDNFDAWSKYLQSFDPEKTMADLPKAKSEQEKRFLTTKNIYNTFYNIRSQELKLSKYVITAPFKGVLSTANVQYGSIIRPGQKLGDFIQPGNFELEAPVNIKDVVFLKEGDPVKLTSTDISGEWTGKIVRIGKNVDARTQSVMVYVQVANDNLKEGMYLAGDIEASMISGSIELPRKLLNNDGTIYIVEDTILAKIKPTVEKIGASTVLLTGIKPDTKILSESFIGAYEGLPVKLASELEKEKKAAEQNKKTETQDSDSETDSTTNEQN